MGMNRNLRFISLLHMAAVGFSVKTNMLTIHATDTLFSGRSREDPTAPGALQFDMPGCSFTFIVENTSTIELAMSQVGTTSTSGGTSKGIEIMWPDERGNKDEVISLKDGFLYPNCFEVLIDNELVFLDETEYHSFCTTDWNQDGSSNLITLPPLDETVSHIVQVFKSSEAQFNSILVEPNYMTLNQINLYGKAPSSSYPVPPTRRIEFLGDSITAGYCNLCDETSESGVFGESHYESWSNQVARQLKADFHSVAWSGYGMVNNCCGGNTTMPMVYARSLASVSVGALYDFSLWVPQVVVINLGTNDISSGKYDEEIYVETYINLLNNMTLNYGDEVSFFLACGPMADRYCDGVKSVIDTYNSNPLNTPTAYFLNQTALDLDMDCCGHPSSQDDVVMANYTAGFISDTVGWS